MFIRRMMIYILAAIISPICFGMENGQNNGLEIFDPSITNDDFNALSDLQKWDRHATLLAEYEKLQQEHRGQQQVCSEQLISLGTLMNLDKKKDEKIEMLKERAKKIRWKTVGVTFLLTVGGLAVLGKVIDKK